MEMTGCLPAIAITLLPNVGFFLVVDFTEDNGQWYSSLDHPSWGVTTGELYFPALLTVNLFQGYASFLVWSDGGRLLPLGIYGAQLLLLWVHFPIFLGCRSLKWGLMDISLTTALAGTAAVLFYQVNPVSGLLMIPYIAVLGYDTLRDFWMYSRNDADYG